MPRDEGAKPHRIDILSVVLTELGIKLRLRFNRIKCERAVDEVLGVVVEPVVVDRLQYAPSAVDEVVPRSIGRIANSIVSINA
jgi:hypothetical protein